MSFSGFSEDDIRKISGTQGTSKVEKGPQKSQIKKVTFGVDNVRSKDVRTQPKIKPSTSPSNAAAPIPEGAKLSVANDLKPSPKLNTSNTNNNITNSRESTSENGGQASALPSDNQIPANEATVLSNNNIEKRNINLDEFEARQKLIEEQNRKRKELLVKALADRTKQTREEAQRLGQIQEEFTKLDAILSKDVKILRRQIELVSVDYMECQKRYQKIEKEYLEAKHQMHQMLEKKEMLTEHLCTIIEKNEERKAEKLTELLNKLEVRQEVVNKTPCEKPDTPAITESGAYDNSKCDSNSQSEKPPNT